jgi:two-component system chemotaxis family response regulator WspR
MTEGYEVTERENGALALHWLSSLVDTEFPDLIIIDRNMPEMSGDECVRIIKMDEDWQSIPLLFLTAQTAEKQAVPGAEFLGADGYICKPFAPDELQSHVRRLISGTPDSSSASEQTAGVMVSAELGSAQVHHRTESEEPMMDLFLAEAGEHAASMASGLQDLKADNVDRDILVVMGRGAHSIKGAGGIVGLFAIADLAGTLETYFKQVQKVPEFLSADHLPILAVALELLTVFSSSPSDDIRTLEIERHGDIERAKSRVGLLIDKGDDLTASSSILRGSPMDPRELDRGDKPSVSNVASGSIATTALETGLRSSRRIVVLLIDDQRIIGESVRSMLESESDIVFHFCQNPTEAVAKALEVQPTVILQDLVMPELDGLELVRRFRVEKELAAVPLIVLSGTEEAKVKAEAFALGANDYMVKLPNALEVIARIRYHSQAYINLLEREDAMARVTWLAEHDPLTGCLNRRTWHEQLEVAIAAGEADHTVAVAICDIDLFKKVNDTYGHQCGDEAIKHVVDIIGCRLDELGCLGRLGGEEFGIFITFPDVSQQSTVALEQADFDFENIRQTLENSPLQWNEHVLNLTISTGVSLYREGEKVEETLSRADAGVYQAKEGGRNKVVVVS